MSPKGKAQLAQEHLETALDDLNGGREKDALNAFFYATEAAIVAISDAHGIDTKRHHGLKADAATELHQRQVLADDFGPLLRQLNQARKDVWYEGDEPQLDRSLEEIAADVERLVDAATGER
ncbi:MAG: HEPN domain-containing protein [Thermoleophilaceae bacterium]